MDGKSVWLIGSGPECDLIVDRPTVSARHCRLTLAEQSFILEDLNSTNGTYVDGRRIEAPIRIERSTPVTLGQAIPMPWPESVSRPAEQIRIGRQADNDLVLSDPLVADYHARILLVDDRMILEDLGSPAGTYLITPGNRIAHAALRGTETVFLGAFPISATELLAAPRSRAMSGLPSLRFSGAETVLGRDPSCDAVCSFPMVSGRHARLFRKGETTLLEDLGSSNGTYVNAVKVIGQAKVVPGDTIGLGSHGFRLLEVPPPPGHAPVPTPLPSQPAQDGREVSWVAELSKGRGRYAALILILQAPVLAALVVMILGGADGVVVTREKWPEAARTLTVACFLTALAGLWFGISNAVAAIMRRSHAQPGSRLPYPSSAGGLFSFIGILTVLGVIQDALFLTILKLGLPLAGSSLPMLGIMVLASAVGVAMVVALAVIGGAPRSVKVSVPALMVALVLLGGVVPMPVSAQRPASALSSFIPSKWAFEALLLLEAERRPTWLPPSPGGDQEPRDVAESAFANNQERAGVRADVLALGAMLVGLVGALLFLVVKPAASGPGSSIGTEPAAGQCVSSPGR